LTPGTPLNPRAVARRWWLVVLAAVIAAAAAAAWTQARDDEYSTAAEILVTPIGIDDQTFLGVQALRQTGDAARTVQTAVGLIDSVPAARRTADALGHGWSERRVRDHTDVQVRGASNLVAVTARAADPDEAAELATTFAQTALTIRREQLAEAFQETIGQVESELDGLPRDRQRSGYADQLRLRLNTLQVAQRVGDPTLSLAQPAPVPTGATGVSDWLLIVAALLAGAVVGLLLAVALAALDRRIRDESDLAETRRIPVLTRVPPRARKRPVRPVDAHRALLAELDSSPGHAGSIMFTSTEAGNGTSSTAVAVALAIAQAGRSVILVDLDLLDPGVSAALGVEPPRRHNLASSNGELEQAVVRVPGVEGLGLLVPEPPADESSTALHLRHAPAALERLRQMADHVVIDTAPLGSAGDALPLARHTDHVILVVRPGHTDRSEYAELVDRLERSESRPNGVVLVGSAGA
jgi:succinoglycan biosynthesis transport protein ExoP